MCKHSGIAQLLGRLAQNRKVLVTLIAHSEHELLT